MSKVIQNETGSQMSDTGPLVLWFYKALEQRWVLHLEFNILISLNTCSETSLLTADTFFISLWLTYKYR